jgi:peptidoglycan/xylan/chitin deacetylase (PgdA/CDA1 family)
VPLRSYARLTLPALLLAATLPIPARAGSGLLEACFAPAQLAAAPSERKPVKGIRRFDAPPEPRALVPFAPVPPDLRGAIRRVELPKGRKLVALTLDLCEQPGEVAGYDGPVFDALRAHGVRATIFAGGKWLLSHPGRAAELVADPSFEIGGHGWAHRNVRGLSGERLADEILAPARAYEHVRARLAEHQCLAPGTRPPPASIGLVRFPYGACSPAALDLVAGAGLLAIQWNVSTGDPSPAQSARAIAGVLMRAKPGDIVIMHANGRGHHTAEALRIALPLMKARGVQFVTVSELLAAGDPVVAPTCYDSRPGDVDRYDALFQRPAQSPSPEASPHVRAAPPVPR